MGFLQIGFLGALAALAVPVIVHLVLGQRGRQVSLGTLRFLKVALRDNARRRRLKRWLLLALRMACVAILALLFARPYLLTTVVPGEDRLVVLLVDRSASMGLLIGRQTLLDRAVQRAEEILAGSGEGAQLALATFDCEVDPLQAQAGDVPQHPSSRSVATRLARVSPSYRSTDYAAAMAWAQDLCALSDRPRKEVCILTDLQRSGIGRSETTEQSASILVHLIDVGQAHPSNLAVCRAVPSSLLLRPGEPVTVEASVLNAGQFAAADVPVVLHLQSEGRQRNARQKLDLEPGATLTVRFELPALDQGLWQGFVAVEVDDDLKFDNRQYAAVKVAPPLRVLLVEGAAAQIPAQAETYFIATALRLAPPGSQFANSPFQPETIACEELSQLSRLEDDDLVVLANVERLGEDASTYLAEFVQRGGGLLVFSGDRVRPDGYESLARRGAFVGRILGAESAGVLPFRLDSWDTNHAIFQPFSDPQHGDLRRFAFRRLTRIEPRDDAQVLAWFPQAIPAVVESRCGQGKVVWFASACDRDWSDWPRSRLYLPLVHQMLGYLARITGGGPVRNATVDELGREAGEVLPGVRDRGSYHEVINVVPRESEMERCSREEFAATFGCTLASDDGDQRENTGGAAGKVDLRPNEVWHWMALLLLGVLFCEGLLANRTTA